jgi:saccharopine dehydrogenase-like NADP-dependent oxidoreductase
MGSDFIVLGATGMQGKIVTRDLLENGYSVCLAGRNKSRVDHLLKRYKRTSFLPVNLEDISATATTIGKSGAKVAINCAEGDWNLHALKASLKAGTHLIDLGSEIPMTKEQFSHDKQLKKGGLIHITGCGSVPGIGNVMLNYAADKFDVLKSIEVGFAWDSNIKEFVVPFSIPSIIEEFTDLAPEFSHSKFINMVPLKDVEVKAFRAGVGKVDVFPVRHPETYTFVHYYKHKGLQDVYFFAGFPKHSFDVIKSLIDVGFADKTEIDFQGKKICPIDFLTETLKRLEIPKGYKEYENLTVELEGKSGGKNKKILMECLVPTLKGWEDAGCNIDTGIPASIMARMIHRGEINKAGSYSPEAIVPPASFFGELAKMKMVVCENGKRIN